MPSLSVDGLSFYARPVAATFWRTTNDLLGRKKLNIICTHSIPELLTFLLLLDLSVYSYTVNCRNYVPDGKIRQAE